MQRSYSQLETIIIFPLGNHLCDIISLCKLWPCGLSGPLTWDYESTLGENVATTLRISCFLPCLLMLHRPFANGISIFQARPVRWWPTSWTTSSARTSSVWRRSARTAAFVITGASACEVNTPRPLAEGAGPSVSPRRSRVVRSGSCLLFDCEKAEVWEIYGGRAAVYWWIYVSISIELRG